MKIHHPISSFFKRTFDICVSIPVVLLIIPILALVVWIAHRIQSPGPLFYTQKRYGMNRETFNIIKFRTMHVNATPGKQASNGDKRIFSFGKFLRKSSLDEIPQFINVLIGDMSVNGPRPFMIEHDHQFEKMYSNYWKRHSVKPGITGLAQSKGLRGEVTTTNDIKERTKYDLLYIRKWHFLMEFSLVWNTFIQVIRPPKSAV